MRLIVRGTIRQPSPALCVAKEHAILLRFGANLRRIRTGLHLSQEALADKSGFDRTYISLLERGKRNLSLLNLCRLAEALNTTITELTTATHDATHAESA